jgi:hypothetical protein
MAKDILKEAIADAKAIREVALANAKAALEEAFTPKLQSMLSAKLSEDLDETMYDEDEKDMEETYMDEEKEDMDEMMYDEDEKDMEEVKHGDDDKMKEADLDEEIDLEEILNELELEEAEDSDKKVDEVKDKDDKDSMEEAKDDDKKMEEAKDDDDKKMEEVKDKDDKDSMEEAKDDEMKKEELDEMGRPIYKSEDANYAGYTADRVHEGDGEFDLDALLEEINNLDEKKDDDEVNESEDTVNETEETNEVVATGLAGIAGLVAAAGGMAKLKMMFQDPEVQKKFPRASKVLDALQSAGSAAGQAMRRENEEMAEELEETKKALETVRGELNEVNLLNSKLLYVNRIFKANTLDESQKLRVVESLDKASSTKEAKLIYETIKDTFNISKNTKSSSKRKSIKENLGMASKATGTSTAPKKEVISESNDMVARFKKLANIKINE